VQKAVNVTPILKRIEHMEKELEAMRVEVLRLKAKSLPPEEMDEETRKAFEEDIKEFVSGKVRVIDGEEASKLLFASLEED